MSTLAQQAPATEFSPERLGAAGLRAFERIAQARGLSVEEQLCLHAAYLPYAWDGERFSDICEKTA